MVSRRGRGRPRGESDARERITAAAVHEFGEHGYESATIRAIAARAGVDPALVHHYFGTKADLFAEAAGFPLRPDVDVPAILRGPREGAGERVARYVLESFERPEVRKRGIMLLRTVIGSKLASPVVAGFLTREMLPRIAGALDADDAQLRASLAASQIVGMIVARHIVKVPGIADATVDELVDRIGPTLQRYLYE
ncbi:TetR/AcrR family transcriptional regulator [Microbacterium sp.]|uniref:TetR/AcrR family transcriptional regulator n=1 Tax=Microbacterium sp. TaxID=51671 RepID=UPI0028115843|nr:TetR family transcriptional regulator [Microbacterium sp.]